MQALMLRYNIFNRHLIYVKFMHGETKWRGDQVINKIMSKAGIRLN